MNDGEGPVTADAAKQRVRGWYDKPEHKPKDKDPRNEHTRDDDISDPGKQKED